MEFPNNLSGWDGFEMAGLSGFTASVAEGVEIPCVQVSFSDHLKALSAKGTCLFEVSILKIFACGALLVSF